MEILSFLSPEQWTLFLALIVCAISALFSFKNGGGKRISDRTIIAIFFVYCIYGILRYSILFLLHAIHGANLPRELTLTLNTFSQIRELYMVFAMLFLIYKGRLGALPSTKGVKDGNRH